MSHIADARARAEATLGSTCVITAPGEGEGSYDSETLARIDPDPTTVWAGPCSVAPAGGQGRTLERAGRQLDGREFRVALPVAATGIARGQTLTVTAVDEDGDPDLTGIPLTVDEVVIRSKTVLRQLRCVDTRGSAAQIP